MTAIPKPRPHRNFWSRITVLIGYNGANLDERFYATARKPCEAKEKIQRQIKSRYPLATHIVATPPIEEKLSQP